MPQQLNTNLPHSAETFHKGQFVDDLLPAEYDLDLPTVHLLTNDPAENWSCVCHMRTSLYGNVVTYAPLFSFAMFPS